MAFVAYFPVLRVGFIWDDHVMIENNPRLSDWSAASLKQDFTTDVFNGHGDPYYRPVQTLMNRADYALWGLRPFGYHLTNLLFHSTASLLVASLATLIGMTPMSALLAGCLFAVHPMGVELQLNLSGRSEVMALAFILLGIQLLLRHQRSFWVLGHFFWLLALFTKESSLVAPALGALVFWLRREPASTYKRLIPFGFYLLPYLGIRHVAVGPMAADRDVNLWTIYLFKAFPAVILQYVQNILLPWNLHSHRMMPRLNPLWPLLLAAVAAWLWQAYRRHWRGALVGTIWVALVILPKAPAMIYGRFMLDHWAYPAVVPVALGLGWFFAKTWDSARMRALTPWAMAVFPILIGWALMTRLNIELRNTDEKMYRWALHFTTSNPIKYNLAVTLLQQRRPAEAIPYLQDYLHDYPDSTEARMILSLAQAELKKSSAKN